MLRKGFTLQPAPGGMGQLTDSRTGDVLILPAADYALLSSGGEEGLDTDRGDISEVTNRYRPFFVEHVPHASFYELDIEDAPTSPQIPSIAPVTMPPPQAATPSDQDETKDEVPLAELMPEDLTQPEGKAAVAASDEPTAADQLNAAQESQHTEDVPKPEAELPEPTRLSAPPPVETPAERPSSKPSPLLLAFAGILILGLGVGATFLLRPELFSPAEGPTQPNPTTVVVPPTPEPVAEVDAGAEPDAGVEEVDAGAATVVAPEAIDAGTPEPVAAVDAGVPAQLAVVEDAGQPSPQPSPPRGEGEDGGAEWVSSEVQARGRVKMGEVVAGASGVVTWSVQEEERVKTKQSLGTIARDNGSQSTLVAPNVGLAMLKQPSGSTVKRGEVLADIIYFEAWAKGLVKARPTTSWRCEIVSASANKKAECKISVITPKSGGSQLMVAVEPRWFDDATDTVLRVAPP